MSRHYTHHQSEIVMDLRYYFDELRNIFTIVMFVKRIHFLIILQLILESDGNFGVNLQLKNNGSGYPLDSLFA